MWNIGQKVVTTQGVARIVAYIAPNGDVYGYARRGGFEKITPLYDAWGGEHDQNVTNTPTSGTVLAFAA